MVEVGQLLRVEGLAPASELRLGSNTATAIVP